MALIISICSWPPNLLQGAARKPVNWPQFRGPGGSGTALGQHPPVCFGPNSNLLWKVEVPTGVSSPIVWGDCLFLTAAFSNQLCTLAYDAATGRELWRQTAPADKAEDCHSFSSPAASTPCTDGKRLFVYFGSFGVLAYDLRGKELWRRPFDRLPLEYGTASSPILVGNRLLLQRDGDCTNSQLVALAPDSGRMIWEVKRPLTTGAYSTPLLWSGFGQPGVVVLGTDKIAAYDPETGREEWCAPGLRAGPPVCSPAFDNQHLFVCAASSTGMSGPKWQGLQWSELAQFDANHDGKIQTAEVPENFRLIQRPDLPEDNPGRYFPMPLAPAIEFVDKDKDGALNKEEWEAVVTMMEANTPVLMALAPTLSRTGPTNNIAWKIPDGIPEIPSPLCYQDRLFVVRDGGGLQCLLPNSGSLLYKGRLEVPGGYSASPVAADDRVYFVSQSGTVIVIDASAERLRVLARNPLRERVKATPAIAHDTLYVRTEKHLFAFAARL